MERAKPYLKAAAVASAVALVGLFVAYRAGAFSTPVPAEPQPGGDPQAAVEQPADPQHPAFMSGSKSTFVFTPTQPNTVSAPSAGQPPTFIGGSKSAEMIRIPKPGAGSQPSTLPQP